MARFVDVIDLPIPPERAFAELADFSRTALWDPGVTGAARLDEAPLGVGSRFEVHVAFLGRSRAFEYAITEFDPPHRVVLLADDASMRLVDEITFAPRAEGTRVAYEVRCEPHGVFRLAAPLLDLALPRIGRVAAAGLRQHGQRLTMRSEVQPRITRHPHVSPDCISNTDEANTEANPHHAPAEARTPGRVRHEGAVS